MLAAEPPPAAPAPSDDTRSAAARPRLTWVELVWIEGRIERWIRFGRVADEQILDRRTRFVGFAAGSVFAFVRWAANARGATALSRLDIVRAVGRGESYATVPGVAPGGEPLLRLTGWPMVEKALRLIDAIEALELDPADVAPDYWRHVHNRLSVGEAARAYTRERHAVWLQRRELRA
jgi:hypothetical protein